MKQMRKMLSLMLALVLAFSLAAVPAFAADTEAESSTSDTAYGQLHNGLLSEILSQIGIANDDNFIHGIVGVKTGDLFDNIASGCNYTHGIVTVSGNVININFGAAITDAKADDLDGENARTILTNICKVPASRTARRT